MSFIYSRALVEASSPGRCSDIDACAQSSGSPTPLLYLPNDKMTGFSSLSRFGMTFKPLTADLGEELLTSWLGGFHARTYPSQEKAQESPEPVAECGVTWRASLAKFDPDTSSWKTVQLSLLGDSELSSVIWPPSGMTAGGQCWELPMSGRRIKGIDSGLLPTPTVFYSIAENMMPKNGDTTRLDKFGRVRKVLRDGRTASMGLARLVAHGATTANDSLPDFDAMDLMNATVLDAKVIANARIPTPGATDGKGASTYQSAIGCIKRGFSPNLSEYVQIQNYQTPVARMYKDNGKNQSELDRNSPTLAMQAGGSLNPTWVEWLMGWPLGWTDLKPLGTDRFHCAQQPLSGC